MKKIKVKDIRKGNYICYEIDKNIKDFDFVMTFFKVVRAEHSNRFHNIWGDKWLDYLDRKKEKKRIDIFHHQSLSGDDEGDGIFYKLTRTEFLKETAHDFMLEELKK